MAKFLYSVPTNNNTVDEYFDDGSIRHNVGDDGLSNEDRAQMEAQSDAYYSSLQA